ncbi:secreted RxLR effector protein 161-like [Photinus pyralis]|uniref:secreted RxLR effector protein 161-like n=1 Tax=Photinus pyralis TaxID=7054 RepID=UPI0012674166|nr:secreted RxLR effector protein 161-like [Photinus pyralis]
MHDCKPVCIPNDVNNKICKVSENNKRKEAEISVYQSAVGKLLYATRATRPDLAYVIGVLCQYCSNSGPNHWTAVKRVMRYLRGTTGATLKYSSSGNPQIIGYCDSNFAGCPDDRKSTTGFTFLLAGGAVTWQSKKQPTVACSTTEAEYMALAQATKEAIWLRRLLRELQLPNCDDPIKIYCDNKGAIDLSKNSVFHARTKHIDIQHHFTHEAVAQKEIVIHKINTEEMVADILTKSLPREKHNWCSRGLGLQI